MRMSVCFPAFVLLIFAAPPPLEAAPWYQRESCVAASRLIFAADLENARTSIDRLIAAPDLDDQACGHWADLILTEMSQVQKRDDARRRAAAERLFRFAFQHRARADLRHLALEARLFQVRHLVQEGRLGPAKKSLETLVRQLERERSIRTPTIAFVESVVGGSMEAGALPVRMLLAALSLPSIAGADRSLESLIEGDTVYRDCALLVAHHFARHKEGFALGTPCRLSADLAERFPTNEELRSLHEADGCSGSG